tara:strand:- start:1541 stop:1954 length:414 start_codon:yes stop_codon:yes gene_type:complete
MASKKIFFFNKNITLLFLFLIFSIYSHFFSNMYFLFSRPYEERILRTYGYGCDKYSFGFVQNIKNNFLKNENAHIIHFGIVPDVKSFFYEIKKDKEKKNLILLYYNNENLKKMNIDISKYQLIHKQENCLYLKKITE